jgi:hypothetical protein
MTSFTFSSLSLLLLLSLKFFRTSLFGNKKSTRKIRSREGEQRKKKIHELFVLTSAWKTTLISSRNILLLRIGAEKKLIIYIKNCKLWSAISQSFAVRLPTAACRVAFGLRKQERFFKHRQVSILRYFITNITGRYKVYKKKNTNYLQEK